MKKSKEELKKEVESLEEQVELYTKIIELREKLIELENKLDNLRESKLKPPTFIPSIWPPYGSGTVYDIQYQNTTTDIYSPTKDGFWEEKFER